MNKKLLLIIILAVLVLGGGGTAAFFMLGGEEDAADKETAKQEEQTPVGLVSMDTFIVNLNDPGEDRYVKIRIKLTVSPVGIAENLDEDELLVARFRDRILTLLSTKTYEDLSTPLGKETLRREIKSRIAPVITEGEIQDVLFSEFVVQ